MWRRAMLVAAAALLVLGGGVLLVARHLLGSDLVRSQIEQQLASRLGQPVHIGSAEASVFPRIGIALRDVTIRARADVAQDRGRRAHSGGWPHPLAAAVLAGAARIPRRGRRAVIQD